MAKGFFVTTDRCVGCKTCMTACAWSHQLDTANGVFIRRVREIDPEGQPVHAFVSMSCNHCDEPACLANCPVGAYTKDPETGLVVQDHSKCIGCQTCVNVCPFHAPCYNEADSTTYKCDGCIRRVKNGERPVCATVCWNQNITLDEFDALAAGGESIKDLVATKPNYACTLDPDLSIDMFADIDGAAYDKGVVGK